MYAPETCGSGMSVAEAIAGIPSVYVIHPN
jgi:hypothetical protein